MKMKQRWHAAALVFLLGSLGCGEDAQDAQITGPDLPKGAGRAYQIEQVSFPSADGVQVSALLGDPQGILQTGQRLPVVILVHDLFSSKEEWAFFLEELLTRQYLTLAIDLRGHGETPLPNDNRESPDLALEDIEESYLDVKAALMWVATLPQADASRVALLGNGLGGNVAYVSTGVFPAQIKAAVVLSPGGLWDRDTLEPLVIGAGQDPFSPHSILYLVGADHVFTYRDQNVQLKFSAVADTLASHTADPKTVKIFSNTADGGLDLLHNKPEAVQLLLAWLETYL